MMPSSASIPSDSVTARATPRISSHRSLSADRDERQLARLVDLGQTHQLVVGQLMRIPEEPHAQVFRLQAAHEFQKESSSSPRIGRITIVLPASELFDEPG